MSLPTLLFGLVTMTTLPVRSGRSSSFHLGLLSISEPTRWGPEPEGFRFKEVPDAKNDMEEERGGDGGGTDSR